MTTRSVAAPAALLVLLGAVGFAAPAAAQVRHHHRVLTVSESGVRYERHAQRGGSALVSDGPGTGYGFHRLPGPFRIGAAIARDRQADAVHQAVINDAIDNADLYHGYPGSSVYQYGSHAAYGVFTGGDSYGTPYFAGYYGPGDGADYGVFGHAYAN